MRRNVLCMLIAIIMLSIGCKDKKQVEELDTVKDSSITKVIDTLSALYPEDKVRIERGAKQVANLWCKEDGDDNEYFTFCKDNFAPEGDARTRLLMSFESNMEKIYGNNLKLTMELMEPLHMDTGELDNIDMMFGSLDPSAHVNEDLFKSKIAFVAILNFPSYTLEEKNIIGEKWSRFDWACARAGDVFTSRVPAEISQNITKLNTEVEQYIADYNICMGNIIGNDGEMLFPNDMKLITHWGLRDEIKSNYANTENGLKKQLIIYTIMERIINQSIPKQVINNEQYTWNPIDNKLFKDSKEVAVIPEGGVRYDYLKKNFEGARELDPYYPNANTAIARAFDGGLEISQKELETLFIELVSSEEVKMLGELVKKRVGRDLEPFDIWYNGFQSRSGISEEELDKLTSAKYPTPKAFQNDIPNILVKLGYNKSVADGISQYIQVDASRGAGHAWGSLMKSEKSRLRTRIAPTGMNYKGYNIAVHELGHNVEQTISLHDVDYYMMAGVPNTGFTEALAFLFQSRDLQLLGLKETNPEKQSYDALNKLWSCYEIMGVSLVDMAVWKWMYEKKSFSDQELQDAVIASAINVWNKYYAPVFGKKDSPILAVYSHMINAPLYLSAYPVGQLIEFQVDKYVADKNLATESLRLFSQGRLTPKIWMKQGIGEVISIQPTLSAAREAMKTVHN